MKFFNRSTAKAEADKNIAGNTENTGNTENIQAEAPDAAENGVNDVVGNSNAAENSVNDVGGSYDAAENGISDFENNSATPENTVNASATAQDFTNENKNSASAFTDEPEIQVVDAVPSAGPIVFTQEMIDSAAQVLVFFQAQSIQQF